MRYEILGPLQIVGDQRTETIEARKVQVVLTTLLVCRDQVVSVEKLIKEIWGERPPRRATAGIHVYISHLRSVLARSGPGHRIVTKPPGYMLQLKCDEIDFDDFQRVLEEGKSAFRTHRYEKAMDSFQVALGLWHGSVVDDSADGPIMRGFNVRLEEMRLECIELLISSAIELGRHRETIGYLYSLINEHPLHEDFYQKLMIALYQSGRRGEALKVYQSARETLKDELGLEPSRELQELQRQILVIDEVR